jgi:hypothetical protein
MVSYLEQPLDLANLAYYLEVFARDSMLVLLVQ